MLLRAAARPITAHLRVASAASGLRFSSSQPPTYSTLLVTNPAPAVTLITLNLPKALNALSFALAEDLHSALEHIGQDNTQKAVVLTGSPKAFAAGADIKEMKDRTLKETYGEDFLARWSHFALFPKPLIAAVEGYALGGGCEVAMMCDIILASPTAVFGQPEINLGVIPGAGGTQRLTHAIGKSRAMELILTGRNFTAQEASDWGLVSRVVPGEEGTVVKEAIKVAERISTKGALAIKAAKEAVNGGKCQSAVSKTA